MKVIKRMDFLRNGMVILSLGLGLLGLAGCGGGADPARLIVGTEATFPPFEMTNERGEIVGFDVDLMTAIAADQGFTLEWRNMEFDSLIAALQAGNIDLAVSGLSITEARRQQVAFSDPYIEAGLVIAVAAGNTSIKGVDDLAGKVVAVQQGATGATLAEQLKAEGKIGSLKYFPNVSVAMMEIANGGAVAMINDRPVTEAYAAQRPGTVRILPKVLQSDAYGFAVAKGRTDLLTKINAGLANVKAAGLVEQLKAKYFDGAVKTTKASGETETK